MLSEATNKTFIHFGENILTADQTTNGEILVPVQLDSGHYEIRIGRGLISQLPELLIKKFEKSRFALITDENVANEHLPTVSELFQNQNIPFEVLTVPVGESSKNFSAFEDLCERILTRRFERNDTILAFGGGVIGDLAGFVASVVKRGMNFVQIPTSLLAQVDSAIGGKTGINSKIGKNLIGTFNHASIVLADTKLLDTLSKRDFRAGYAELVKYGLINDLTFFEKLENNWREVFSGGIERDDAVATACRAKVAIIEEDERETGNRALLNLGHTFGHALEAATEYDSDRLVHGEGVAIGIALAFKFSEQLGLSPPADTERVIKHFQAVGLPANLHQIPGSLPTAEVLLDHIAQDKKVRQQSLTFILTRGIGQAFIEHDVEPQIVSSFLQESLKT